MLLLYLVFICGEIILGSGHGGFVEVPMSVTVLVNDTATFRCRHSNADYIEWRVNGTSVSTHAPIEINPGFVRDEDDNLIDTLNITATSVYNNSKIVCVAQFFGRESLSTDAAILQVLPRTTVAPSSSLGPTGFIIAPISKNATVGATVRFTCQHTNGDVVWRINGEREDRYSAASTESTGGLRTLTISNAPANYDGAKIQCMVYLDDQVGKREWTRPATLRLQGQLDTVSDVHINRNSSTLSWDAPFSLDLTGVHPDIVYCVEVYNITCGRRDLIISDCNVTEPSYTSDDIAPHGYIYEYIITPRSNVPGARNGTPSQPLRERFTRLGSSVNERKNMDSLQIAFANPELNRPVPTYVTLSLKSIDGLEDHQHNTTNITKEGDIIVVEVIPGLPSNRLWNCTILAYGCPQNKLLSEIELSTHDLQNISISSPLPGQLRVTGDFLEGSTATGALVTIVNESDVQHHLSTRGNNENEIEVTISGLAAGQYTVSVFVLDARGIPLERAATKPRQVSMESGSVGGESQPLTVKYKVKSTSTGVCITCTFLDSSTTGCVAVVHQRISQLSSSGLMNIESSHKLSRSGDTAQECIEGIDVDNFQVEVIGAIRVDLPENGSWVCGTTCIVIIVVLVLTFLVLVVSPFVVICFVCKQIQPGKKKHNILRIVHNHSPPSKNMKSGSNNVTQCDSKAIMMEDSAAAPISPLLTQTEERSEDDQVTEKESRLVPASTDPHKQIEQNKEIPELKLKQADELVIQCQDKKREVDCNESAAIDTEAILVVDEARTPGTPQADIHAGSDKVISESAYREEPDSEEETPADQAVETEPNKDKESSPSSITNVQPEGKRAEPADAVPSMKPNNGMKTAPEDSTDILQAEPVAHSTPRKGQYGCMQTDSSATEKIVIYHNFAEYTREDYNYESGRGKAYITHEGGTDDVGEALDACKQSVLQPGHNSSHTTKGEDKPPEADSDYASMPLPSHDVDSCTSNEPDSEIVKAEYQFKPNKAPQAVPSHIMVGHANNSCYIPDDSGISNFGVSSDTFTMFLEDKSCQTAIGDHKPFTELQDGVDLNHMKSEPVVKKPIQD